MSRDAFTDLVGLPRGPFLLYSCSSLFVAPDEVSFFRQWLTRLRSSADEQLRDCSVLVRPHPGNASQWDSFVVDDPRLAVWPRGGDLPLEDSSRQRYFDTLHHATAIVGVNSSSMLEAGIVGRRSFTLLAPEFAHSQRGTLHFEHLLAHGFVTAAASWDEHWSQLAAVLRDGGAIAADVRQRMMAFVRPGAADQPSTAKVADAIEETARQLRPAVTAAPSSPLVLRLLRPLARAAARRRDAARSARRRSVPSAQ